MKTRFLRLKYILNAKEKKSIILLMLMMIVIAVMEAFSIAAMIPVLIAFLNSSGSQINQESQTVFFQFINKIAETYLLPLNENKLLMFFIFLLMVYFVRSLLLVFFTWSQAKLTANLKINVSMRLYKGYLGSSIIYHAKRKAGELVRNITGEAFELISVFTSLITLLIELLVVTGLTLVVLFYDPYVTLIIVFSNLFIGSLYYFLFKDYLLSFGKKRQDADIGVMSSMIEGLRFIREIKIYKLEKKYSKYVQDYMHVSAKSNIFNGVIQSISRNIFEIVIFLVLILSITFSIYVGRPMEHILVVIAIIATISFRLMPSANRISNSLQSLKYNIPVIDKIYSEVKSINQESDHKETTRISANFNFNSPAVKIEKLKFAFDEKVIFDNFDLEISNGEKILLLGKSGSGKTTLLNIIFGLIMPDSGKVLINNENPFDFSLTDINYFGYAPQGPFFINDTIYENICLGRSISNKKFNEIINISCLNDIVQDVSDAKKLHVSDGGSNLSGGQKQRLAIARSLISNPKFLIFDESLTGLDEKNFEKVFSNVLDYVDKYKITFINVSHDPRLRIFFKREINLNRNEN